MSRHERSHQRHSWIKSPYARRLRVEALEDRRMLAVLTVQNNLDDTLANLEGDGELSLREAIEIANNPGAVIDGFSSNDAADTIDFSISGTIILASQLPTISNDLTITGPSQPLLTIDAGDGSDNNFGNGDGYRIFEIDDTDDDNDISVEISDLSLTGGAEAVDGGAILNRENLSLTAVHIHRNWSQADGGGIFSTGTLSVIDSTIAINDAGVDGGGIFSTGTLSVSGSTIESNDAGDDGGGIYNTGTLSITGSTIEGNDVEDSGGGILNSGILDVANSTLRGNTAIDSGGGIWTNNSTTIIGSTIAGNRGLSDFSIYLGGGGGIKISAGFISISDSTIIGNTTNSLGGGVYNGGTLTLGSSIIVQNSAGRLGGGILNASETLHVIGSTIVENYATDGGGGIMNGGSGTTTITSSTISGNEARYGAGFSNSNTSTASISSSTISGNDASFRGGGIHNGGRLDVAKTTISGNEAGSAGGIYNFGSAAIATSTIFGNIATSLFSSEGAGGIWSNNNGTATVTSSIVAGSISGLDLKGSGSFSGGFNLIGDGSELSSFSNSLQGASHLGPLADNGGLTKTHALLPDSRALNAGGGPLHYYRFEGDATDSAGGNDGTLSGGADLSAATDVLGSTTAVAFDGVDDYVQLASGLDSIDEDASSTVEAWVKVPSTAAGRVGIILGNFADDNTFVGSWEIHDNGQLHVSWDQGTVSASTSLFGITDLRDDQWHHIAIVRDTSDDEFRAYIDGKVESLDGPGSTANTAGDDFVFTGKHRIGNDNRTSPGIPFQGAIDELAIYDRAFTPGEILARASGNVDQRGHSRWVGRIDIGAYEAQVSPSADFNSDGDVDGDDFLTWQRGFGMENAVRADGNSDDDTDVDASDLAAWTLTYGEGAVAAPVASDQESGTSDGAVGAAWALLSGSSGEDLEILDEQRSNSALPLVSSLDARVLAPRANRTAYRDAPTTSEQSDEFESWLDDELLERVFG